MWIIRGKQIRNLSLVSTLALWKIEFFFRQVIIETDHQTNWLDYLALVYRAFERAV